MAKDKSAEMREDEMHDEGSGPRVYELGFHLDPELPTEEVKKTYSKVKGIIEANSSIVAEAEPVKIQLAYTIKDQQNSGRRDFDSAYFAWIVYECDTAKHAEIVSELKTESRIIRSLDVTTTKEIARHMLEMHELSLKAPEKKSEEESTVSDTELDAALEEVTV